MTLRRKLAIFAILSTVALVSIAVVLEGGARMMGIRAGRRRVFDAQRGWTYVPNTVFQYISTKGRIIASVDGEGFRPTVAGADQADAPALVCLGDSYTFCGESPDDRTWPEFMAREMARKGLPCRAVNRGVTGYSSIQSLVALRHELRKSAGEAPPKGVLYLFCLNDPGENFEPDRPHLDRAEFAGSPASIDMWKPKEHPPADPPPRSLRVILRELRSPSAFINALKTAVPNQSPAAFSAGAATYADLYGPTCREFLDSAVHQEGVRYALRELRKECAARGVPLFVSSCVAPAWDRPGVARQEFSDLVKWSRERMEAQVADYNGAIDFLARMAEEEGATFIDVRGCMDGMKYREYAAASDDWHFSEAANERIGKAIADRLFPHLAGTSAGTR